MIKYCKLNDELKQKVYDCYNNNVGDFYKKMSYDDFCLNLYNLQLNLLNTVHLFLHSLYKIVLCH